LIVFKALGETIQAQRGAGKREFETIPSTGSHSYPAPVLPSATMLLIGLDWSFRKGKLKRKIQTISVTNK
jgi:hypothetical protein